MSKGVQAYLPQWRAPSSGPRVQVQTKGGFSEKTPEKEKEKHLYEQQAELNTTGALYGT